MNDSIVPSPAQIQAAARLLEAGALVAFPTETVYGLGADAENPKAVARIYRAKGRPSNHPVIAHLAPDADLNYWATDVPAAAEKLIRAFCPGPLTLILKRAAHIPDTVSDGQDTIGLRWPSHPVAVQLLRVFKNGRGGVAAPSANRFGHVSPTTAQHVRDEFAHEPLVEMVLDGGASGVGIESTILDLSRMATHGPVLLRPGHIQPGQIAECIGDLPATPDAHAPRASGTLAAHYAPRTPLLVLDTDQLDTAFAQLKTQKQRFALMAYSFSSVTSDFPYCHLGTTVELYARQLYAALRQMDGSGVDVIILEAPPNAPQWHAVRDRIRRAAHDSRALRQKILK